MKKTILTAIMSLLLLFSVFLFQVSNQEVFATGETVTLGSTVTVPGTYIDSDEYSGVYGSSDLYLISKSSNSASFVLDVYVEHSLGGDSFTLTQGGSTVATNSSTTDGTYEVDVTGLSADTTYILTFDFTYETMPPGGETDSVSITFTTASAGWTVTYDSNGGSAVTAEEDIEDDDYATEPTDPTRLNYTFAGWFTDDGDFTDEWDFTTDTVTEDITLYAKWTQSVENKFTQWGRAVHTRLTAVEAPSTNTEDANYTLALTDAGKVILAGHATNAVKITIPLNSAVEFPTNTEIAVVRYLAGVVTIGTSDGATLNGVAYTTTFTLGDQYTSVAIKKVGTDAWIMTGNFEETA